MFSLIEFLQFLGELLGSQRVVQDVPPGRQSPGHGRGRTHDLHFPEAARVAVGDLGVPGAQGELELAEAWGPLGS